MTQETIALNQERNVTLTAYTQEVGGAFWHVARRPGILILPGGGYQYCSPREAEPVAFAYLKAGYQVFILRYSVREHAVWPNPLDDYEQAMELIRSKADEWNLYPEKIAVIGFSAGGHLAAAAATMSRNRPNAAILGYAVTGGGVNAYNEAAPDTVSRVDRETCPCFIFSTCNDELVPVHNSVSFISALARAGVSFESHIYNYGPHGISTGDPSVEERGGQISSRAPNWLSDSIGWLGDMFGEFGIGGMTEPKCKPLVGCDHEPYLSTGCTIGLLLSNPESRVLLQELTQRVEKKEVSLEAVRKLTLRGLYGFLKVPQETMEKLDSALRKIKNS